MPTEGTRFGPYLLLRRIGRGGMAEVFLAQQRGLEGFDRRVAVKRILPHHATSPDFIEMFLGEARLAAQLSHPNIVHIYDFGKVDGDYFIAMEYVDGVDAGQVFRRTDGDRLPPAMVARIGADAAAALHFAHELRSPSGQPYGLVHRDVSPANLMVSFDGVVKLCDFGLAKAVALGGRQLTHPGLIKGKYAYMSPEQTAGAQLDGRSDVYALAIVLWELLAGTACVPRGDPVAAMRVIRNGKLTPLAEAAPWTPPALAEAITWALATRREQRATAVQLGQTLEAFIKSSPEIATPMQLGSWLRARFAREPLDEPGNAPAASLAPPTQDAPASRSMPLPPTASAEASLRSRGSLGSAGTMSETVSIASADPANAPTVMAAEPVDEAADDPAEIAERHTGFESTDPPAELPIFAPAEPLPDDARPSLSSIEHRDTLLRSGAFRPLVPSGPSAVPTLVDPRPAAAHAVIDPRPAMAPTMIDPRLAPAPTMIDPRLAPAPTMPMGPPPAGTIDPRTGPQLRTSPMFGFPAMPVRPTPRSPAMRPATRVALIGLGMCSLAVLSFAIVLGARGPRRSPADRAAVLVPPADAPPADAPPADAPPADAPPADAPPADAPPSDTAPADAVAPVDAGALVPPVAVDAGTAARLEVQTRPAGASVAIIRCPAELASCSARRSAEADKIDGCAAAPCHFQLPVGNYEIIVELDGATERRSVALMADVTTSLDILLRSARRGRPIATGKLTVHTRQRCELVLDGRRHLQAPVTELELRPGVHKLELTCGNRTLTRTATITAGKTTELTIAPR